MRGERRVRVRGEIGEMGEMGELGGVLTCWWLRVD